MNPGARLESIFRARPRVAWARESDAPVSSIALLMRGRPGDQRSILTLWRDVDVVVEEGDAEDETYQDA
jgi:hypothetical protein